MFTSYCLTSTINAATCDTSLFRKLVGSLQYLAITHLDVAYPIDNVSQFLHAPQEILIQSLKRILG